MPPAYKPAATKQKKAPKPRPRHLTPAERRILWEQMSSRAKRELAQRIGMQTILRSLH